MADPLIRLTFDGGDASQGAIDMRLLGQSLQGADRIISDGLIVLAHNRLPKRGERAPLILKVKEPVYGSYDIPGFLADAAFFLPLGMPIIADLGASYLTDWIRAVIARFSGKTDIAEQALEALTENNRQNLLARDAAEQRHHAEAMGYQELLRTAMRPLGPSAEAMVAPIGPSAQTGVFRFGSQPGVQISTVEADLIRDYGKLEWSSLGEIGLKTDGFKFHTNGLSVENPDSEGFLMAKVSDPRFKDPENVYTEAAGRRSKIVVLARRGYREGKLSQIDIADFVREELTT